MVPVFVPSVDMPRYVICPSKFEPPDNNNVRIEMGRFGFLRPAVPLLQTAYGLNDNRAYSIYNTQTIKNYKTVISMVSEISLLHIYILVMSMYCSYLKEYAIFC